MEEVDHLVAGLESFVRHYGAFAVMPILAFEAVGAPVPGETLLIFASVLAGRGEMSLTSLLIFAWAGLVAFRIARRSRISSLGDGLGVRPCLFQRASDLFYRAGTSHQGGR